MIAVVVAGCSVDSDSSADSFGKLHVYATTGYLADAVVNIAPDAVVTTMVGPGGDPHSYQPSTRDIVTMREADLVLWNGLYLEAQMIDQLRSLGASQLAVAETVSTDLLLAWPEIDHEGNALNDPHIWNSPTAWIQAVQAIVDKITQIDPENAAEYSANAANFIAEIQNADKAVTQLLADIPEHRRVLVTGHDAFNYFGESYGFEVHATDFVSTDAMISPQQLSQLARYIADNQVPVIFHDNQVNPQAITSLKEAVRALGWQVEVSEAELYADTLGADPGVDSYLGAFLHNANAIAAALGE